MRRRIALLAAVSLGIAACPRVGAAALVTGTIETVNASARSVAIAARGATRVRSYRVLPSAQVTVDGRRAGFSELKAGMQITIFTSSATIARRVIARTARPATPSSTPPATTPSRPKSKAPTQPPSNPSTPSRPASAATNSNAPWPQFRGPNRDNISRETGLLKSWPSGGPRLLWTARGLGEGYSAVSIANGLIYTMGNTEGAERIIALDPSTGRQAWTAVNSSNQYRENMGNGPRGTPTVDGKRVYALGATGDLTCADAQSGEIKWQKNVLREFGGRVPTWGICESVLIDGDKLICTPGGRGGTMVALDKNTGRVLWRASAPGNHGAAYASPIIAQVGRVKQYVNFTSSAVIGVRATDGRVLWGETSSSNGTANCSSPVFADGHVFSASAYGTGGALVRLQSRGTSTSATRVYHTRSMKNHHGGMVALDGYLYGSDSGILTCLELRSGRAAWKERTGKGSIIYADGHIVFRSERGPVLLCEATPQGFREKGRFDQPQRSGKPSWAHPVIADGKLYLRDQDVLLCYDLQAR